ncbi:MAG TPA: MXAN_5187 C-terminal domain-containing protein [Kofleriaceae bacterium]|nr:MXAN_5187 C-terminal domain-containing protein [Kofleriaceae bacterium]
MALKSTFGDNQAKIDIEERLDVLEKQLDRLKVMYEQYFMGIQKIPPAQLHRDVERGIRDMTQLNIRNTGLRYRFSTIGQKDGSYNSYWRRIMREIEQGRYVRDVRRAGQRAAAAGMDMPAELLGKLPKRIRDRIVRDRAALANRAEREGKLPAEDAAAEDAPVAVRDTRPKNVHTVSKDDLAMLEGDLDMDAMFDAITQDAPKAPALTPAPRSAPKPVPAAALPSPTSRRPASVPARLAPAGPPGMSEGQTRALYDRYVQARKLVGERTDNLSYDKLVSTLSKQAPAIMKQHNAKGVEFDVVVKGDKVVLKAKPKK